jgi:hypothetical protein
MKRFCILAFLLVSAVHAQSYHEQNNAFSSQGSFLTIVPNATITVCLGITPTLPCTPALIYQDVNQITPQTNPFTSDSSGNYGFFYSSATITTCITGPTGTICYPISHPAPSVTNAINLTGPGTISGNYSTSGSFAQTGASTQTQQSSPNNQAQNISLYSDFARPTCTGPSIVSVTAMFTTHAETTPTYVNTPGSSTPCYDVALMTNAIRSGSRTDWIWGFNPVVNYNNAGSVQGIEIDFQNNYQDFTLGGADTNGYSGISVVSGGPFSPDAAIRVSAGPGTHPWRRGLVIANTGLLRGIEFDNSMTYALWAQGNMTNFAQGTWTWQNDVSTHALHVYQPAADDTNAEIYGVNAAASVVKWQVDNSGNLQSNSVKPGAGIAVSALPSAAANPGMMVYVTDSTAVAAEGQTCAGSSTNKALAFSNGVIWKCF